MDVQAGFDTKNILMLVTDWIKKIIKNNQQLPVDKQIANQVVAILAATALFSGILNSMMGYPWWFPWLIFAAVVLSFLHISLSFLKTKFVIPRAVLIAALYIIVSLLWFYNPGLSWAPLILSFAIIVFSIGIYNKKFITLFLLNFSIVAALVIIGVLYPSNISFSYKSETQRLIDILGTYFLLGLSVVMILRTIINSYIKAKSDSEQQKKQLEELNAQLQNMNEKLRVINEELMVAKVKTLENDENYRMIAENINDVIWKVDLKTDKIVYVSPSVLNLTGYTVEEVREKSLSDILTPDSLIAAKKKILERLEIYHIEGENFDPVSCSEYQIINKDGGSVWIELSDTFVKDDAGNFDSVFGVARNITKRKKIENELLESEDKFRTIFNNLHVLICIADLKTSCFVNVNPEFTNVLGYSHDDLLNRPFIDFIHPDDRQGTASVMKNELGKGKMVISYTNRYQCKDGTYRWFNWNSYPAMEKGIAYAVAIDITDLMKAEQALKESNELLTLFIKNSPIHAFIKDVNENQSRVIFASDNFSDMIGIKGTDMVGKTMEELFPFEFARKISLDDWMVVQSNKIINIDENLNNRNYTTFKYPILLGNRNLLAGYTIEITERIKAENLINEQNTELKKLNADKDRFMSILAHDLKNPFNAVLGLSELILKNIDTYDIDKIKSFVEYINQVGQNTYDLLNDLLAWSKNQAGMLPFMPEKILLADVCNEVLSTYKISFETKEIVAEYEGNADVYVYADSFMLKTVVRNLLANSIKFTKKGGRIKIKTEIANQYAVITVSDTGVGISRDNIARLWEQSRQFTTVGTAKEEGSGFGLLLCKDFVEKHGGKIMVESEAGKGSDFQFTIPLYIE